MSKICEKCGFELKETDKFCPGCGEKTPDAEVLEPTPDETLPDAEPAASAIPQPVEETAEPTEQPKAEESAEENVEENASEPQENVAQAPETSETDDSAETAELQNEAPAIDPSFVPSGALPKKKKGKGLLIAIIIILVLLIAGGAVLVYYLFFNAPKYEQTARAYFKYMETLSHDDLVRAVGVEALNYFILDDAGYDDLNTFNCGVSRMAELYEAAGVSITVSNISFDNVEKMSDDDIDSVMEQYFDDSEDISISEGYIVEVSYDVEGGDLLSLGEDESDTYVIASVNGDWSVLNIASDLSEFLTLGELSEDDYQTYLDTYSEYKE